MNNWNRATRRQFLKSAGISLAMPFLPSIMLPRSAWGQTATAPKRLISIFTSNGQRKHNLYPMAGADPGWTVRDAAGNVREYLLANLPGGTSVTGAPISKVFPAEFNAYKDKMMIIRGLDCIQPNLSHLGYTMLSGNAGGGGAISMTIDQALAFSPKIYPQPAAVPFLHPYCTLDTFPSSVAAVSIDSTGKKVDPIHDPAVSFDLLFKNFTNPSDPAAMRKMSRQQKVIDSMMPELTRLKNLAKLSSEDKTRLSDHQQKLADLKTRLAVVPSTSCTKPARPTSIPAPVVTNIASVTKTHLDLLVMAIKCDLTRVCTFALVPPTDTRPNSFYTSGIAGDHHNTSHEASTNNGMGAVWQAATDQLGRTNNWYAQQILYLIKELNVPEPGTNGTYLDNTLIIWGNEDGTADFDVHPPYSMPLVLFGNVNGYFKMGRYLDYSRPGVIIPNTGAGHTAGRPYNNFLVSVFDAFGLQPADYERGGRAGWSDYTQFSAAQTAGTWTQFIDTDTKRRTPLPFLKS